MTDIKLYASDYVLFDKDKQALVEDLDIIYNIKIWATRTRAVKRAAARK